MGAITASLVSERAILRRRYIELVSDPNYPDNVSEAVHQEVIATYRRIKEIDVENSRRFQETAMELLRLHREIGI